MYQIWFRSDYRRRRVYAWKDTHTDTHTLSSVAYPELVSRGVSKSRKFKWLVKALIGTQPVTTTDNFTYLGSTIASNNSSFNDVNRRIAIATSTMSKLSSLWTSSRLSLALKMRLYNSLIISIITYSSASWTLTKAQKKRLDAFNTKALRRIVGVRWHDFVTNASILIRTGQPSLMTTIRKLRLSAFGHICRLQPGTQAIDILAYTPPSTWHRPRGRPPLRWADQIVNDTQLSLSDAVTATQDRTCWRSLVRDATRPATQAT